MAKTTEVRLSYAQEDAIYDIDAKQRLQTAEFDKRTLSVLVRRGLIATKALKKGGEKVSLTAAGRKIWRTLPWEVGTRCQKPRPSTG